MNEQELRDSFLEWANENSEQIGRWLIENQTALIERIEKIKQAEKEANDVIHLLENGTLHDFDDLTISGLAFVKAVVVLEPKAQEQAKKMLFKDLSALAALNRQKEAEGKKTKLKEICEKYIPSSLTGKQALPLVKKIYNEQKLEIPYNDNGMIDEIASIQKKRNR
ncbi:MAG: hypothetical protein ACXWTP_05485 [Methylosarcina sp.]